MKRFILGAGISLALVAMPAVAQSSAASVAEKFGALEAVGQASLSPDGKKFAFISQTATGTSIYVADLENGGDPQRITGLKRNDGSVLGCVWTSMTRLVCKVYFIVDGGGVGLLGATRQIAVDADGKNPAELSASKSANARGYYQDGGRIIDYDVEGNAGSVLMTRQFLPDDVTGSRVGRSKGGLGVERIDTASMKRTTVEQPLKDAVAYISDGRGNVRIMGSMASMDDGTLRGGTMYFFRKPGARSWDRLSTVTESGSGFAPVAVDSAKNVAYGFDDDGDFQALYSVALDGSGTRTKIVSKAGIDVDSLIMIGRHRRVVGAGYASDRRSVDYFDTELNALSARIHKALPGQPMVDIVDASEDESKILLVASGDTIPGQYYLYDKTKRQLSEVLPARPALSGTTLATMKPVSFKAADGTDIPGYLTLPVGSSGKGLPAIVMPHGGPSARDEWGFDWMVQFFAARGFAVLQPNFRGSSGYGSDFFQKNGFQSWRTAIGDVNDAGRWLVSQGIAKPDKLAIVGWSYGGYAALQSAVLDPTLYKAIVAVAPVVDLAKLKVDAQDYVNSGIVARFVGDGPHIKEGSPAQNAKVITAPVLMFSGDHDLNVSVSQARLMKSRLEDAGKSVSYIEFPGLDHQLADSAARTRLLSESDAFLRKALNLPAN